MSLSPRAEVQGVLPNRYQLYRTEHWEKRERGKSGISMPTGSDGGQRHRTAQ
jgi:hypothetical protein